MATCLKNSEYDAAKEMQAQIEAEIAEMEDILLSCHIINKKDVKSDEITIGSTVKLYDEEFDEELEYKILGTTESNPAKGLSAIILQWAVLLLVTKRVM